ncbi:MAG TPA: PDZ domain-containing protein [Nitrospiria bacterium]|nr:PDZ domain-containing protein [Nitrospiria bacterium]
MTDAIRYRITPSDPAAHLFEVRCAISHPASDGQRFSLPTWIPGSYLIRDFARHVVRVSAESGGRPVAVTKLDSHTWACEPVSGPLTVISEVYAWDLSVRAAHLDAMHGYFNGTSVFFQIHGQEHRPCAVEIAPPSGETGRTWRVGTALRRDGAPPHGFGRYAAGDYDELMDHPVEMGDFTLATFSACGVPHDVILTGRHRADVARLCRDLTAVCEYHIRFFGEPAPFDRYVFLITAVGEGYGGLEHRASSSLSCSREDLPKPGDRAVTEKYRTFLALASHEYFHAWNVKRIKPQAFMPYDLAREAYTRLLWAFEGITSYYDALALVRTGLIPPASYLDLLGQTVTRLLRGPGRLKQTVEDSSFDAWIKFYKPDENTPNAVVSYYTKGALAALALDLTIRRETRNAKSLDDVMRALWDRYGKTGAGVPEDGIERIAGEVSGTDLREFFDRTLRTVEDLPLADLLADVGVALNLRAAESDQDKGGKAGATPQTTKAVLGVRLAEGGSDAKLATVYDGSAAHAAGLAAGDVIVAVDGLRAGRGNIEPLIGAYQPGAVVPIHAFRRDELMTFDVSLKPAPMDTCFLTLRDEIDDPTRARRATWLGRG